MQKHRVEFQPSKQFIFLYACLLCFIMAVILSLSCFWLIKLLLLLSVAAYGFFVLRQYGFLSSSHPIVGLTCLEWGWQLHEREKNYPAQLCGSSTVTRHLCILRFIVPGSRFKRSCLVFQDSFLCKEGYRAFLLLLRLNRPEA